MTFEMLLEERKEEAFAQGREKGIKEGIEKGAYNTRLETAKNLLSINLPVEQISMATGLSIAEISALKKN